MACCDLPAYPPPVVPACVASKDSVALVELDKLATLKTSVVLGFHAYMAKKRVILEELFRVVFFLASWSKERVNWGVTE